MPSASFVPQPRRGTFVVKNDVRGAIEKPGTCLIDAMSPEHYRGELSVGYPDRGTFAPR